MEYHSCTTNPKDVGRTAPHRKRAEHLHRGPAVLLSSTLAVWRNLPPFFWKSCTGKPHFLVRMCFLANYFGLVFLWPPSVGVLLSSLSKVPSCFGCNDQFVCVIEFLREDYHLKLTGGLDFRSFGLLGKAIPQLSTWS